MLRGEYNIAGLVIRGNVIDDGIVTKVFIGFDVTDLHEVHFDDYSKAAEFLWGIEVMVDKQLPLLNAVGRTDSYSRLDVIEEKLARLENIINF